MKLQQQLEAIAMKRAYTSLTMDFESRKSDFASVILSAVALDSPPLIPPLTVSKMQELGEEAICEANKERSLLASNS